jgi:hypothetical protein
LIGTDVTIATILIDFAFNRNFSALTQRIASISGQTRALGLMFLSSAYGVYATHTSDTARTLTETVNTRLIKGTVVVHSTADYTFLFQTNPFETAVLIVSTFGRDF